LAQEIINRVRRSIDDRNAVIKELYKDAAINKAVIGTLVKMGCDEKTAQDCKTDAIIAFIKSCYKPEFQIKSSITNYLIGAAKNIWLKGVTKTKLEDTTEEVTSVETDPSIEDSLISHEKKQLLNALINKLDDTCKKVLALWTANHRMKKIAEQMNYKSEGMARKKKHQCMQRLYAIIADNPGIKAELRTML